MVFAELREAEEIEARKNESGGVIVILTFGGRNFDQRRHSPELPRGPPRASLTGQTLSFTHLLFKIGVLTLEMTRRYISLSLIMMSYWCHLSYGKIEYEWRRGGIG